MKIIKDHEFERNEVPMTKYIQRLIIMGLLEVSPGDRFLDIGMGTGSISVQAGLLGAKVAGIDKNPKALEIAKINGEKFGVEMETIQGQAPEDLPNMEIDKCFIGGAGGRLDKILTYLQDKLVSGGIVLGAFIITSNAMEFKELLEEYGYKEIETRLIQVSQENDYGMMMGQNPIYIIKGIKND